MKSHTEGGLKKGKIAQWTGQHLETQKQKEKIDGLRDGTIRRDKKAAIAPV